MEDFSRFKAGQKIAVKGNRLIRANRAIRNRRRKARCEIPALSVRRIGMRVGRVGLARAVGAGNVRRPGLGWFGGRGVRRQGHGSNSHVNDSMYRMTF
jgi:hypothetical protein